jgi:hypothetical protein
MVSGTLRAQAGLLPPHTHWLGGSLGSRAGLLAVMNGSCPLLLRIESRSTSL